MQVTLDAAECMHTYVYNKVTMQLLTKANNEQFKVFISCTSYVYVDLLFKKIWYKSKFINLLSVGANIADICSVN